MYEGCSQNIVAPPIILNSMRRLQNFLTFLSSLKPLVGGASYYIIIFLDVGQLIVCSSQPKTPPTGFLRNFENCLILKN